MDETFITKIIEGWRITIPKQIREKLGLTMDDFVEVQVIRKISKTNKKHAITISGVKTRNQLQ